MCNFCFPAFRALFMYWTSQWKHSYSISLCICSRPNCLGNRMPTCQGGFHLIVLSNTTSLPACIKRQQLLSNKILFEHKEPSGQKCREKHTFPLLAFCSTLIFFSVFVCVFFIAPLALIELFICLFNEVYLYVPIMCKRMICVIPVRIKQSFLSDV